MAAHRVRTGARHRTLVAGVAVAVGMVGLAGCGSGDLDAAPVERKAFAFEGTALTVDAGNSELELVPADVKDVQVTRQVDGWVFMGSGPDATWKLEDGTLTLRVECDGLAADCDSRHRIKVPRGVAVVVRNDNGAVTADGFATALDVRSDNGEVTVRNTGGPLKLESDHGQVTVERSTAKSVVARSDNGEVRLGLSAVPDRVETFSDNGAVTIDLPRGSTRYAVTANSRNGDVAVDVPTDDSSAHVVKAQSHNGEVTVRTAN